MSKPRLRLILMGDRDGGRTTLLGRLLFDTTWHLDEATKARVSAARTEQALGRKIDLASLAGELVLEPDTQSSLSVRSLHLQAASRNFIILDTPDPMQVATLVEKAAGSDAAVVLINAETGLSPQVRRHALILSLLGIRHLLIVINKIDQVRYQEDIFFRILNEFNAFIEPLHFLSSTAIPISALLGDNVVGSSAKTPWYPGPDLQTCLEFINIADALNNPLRFSVYALEPPESGENGYSGTVIAGSAEIGHAVRALPSGEIACINDITLGEDSVDLASDDQQLVRITLDRTLELTRGDLLVAKDAPCEVSDQFDVSLVWMDREQGFTGRSYDLLIGINRTPATLTSVRYKYSLISMDELATQSFRINDIGRATLSLSKAIAFEVRGNSRDLSCFVLTDRYTGRTVAAGAINFALRRAQNVHHQALVIDKTARAELKGHKGKVLWFTGLSGSGKSTLANAVEQALYENGMHTYILDGDNVRHGLTKDLGFTDADRVENIRRIAEVAKLMVDAGLVVLTAFISPFRSERDMARAMFEPHEFVEIHVDVPLSVAEERDPKGLYRKARNGELPNFTGIDSAYEIPVTPEITLPAAELSVDDCVELVLEAVNQPADLNG